MSTRLACAFDSLSLEQGGVSRVGRLICQSLMHGKSVIDVKDVSVVTLIDTEPQKIGTVDSHGCSKNKLRFILRSQWARVRATHCLYSFLGLARSHHILPFPSRPYIAMGHGIEIWPGSSLRTQLMEAAVRASRLFVNSQHTKTRALEANSTFERASVVWLATEDDTPVIQKPKHDLPRVTIIGRIDEGYKGHRELIEQWPHIVAAVPGAMLTIAGRGPRMDEYQKLAAQSSVSANIEFLGFVPEEKMPDLWSRTSVFAMPSRGEGFGLVYIEAMRFGIPVIASIHDAGNEVNADGETGFNVNMDKPDELTERIIHLLKNRDDAKRLGQNGQRRWKEHFCFSAFHQRFQPILKEFLSC